MQPSTAVRIMSQQELNRMNRCSFLALAAIVTVTPAVPAYAQQWSLGFEARDSQQVRMHAGTPAIDSNLELSSVRLIAPEEKFGRRGKVFIIVVNGSGQPFDFGTENVRAYIPDQSNRSMPPATEQPTHNARRLEASAVAHTAHVERGIVTDSAQTGPEPFPAPGDQDSMPPELARSLEDAATFSSELSLLFEGQSTPQPLGTDVPIISYDRLVREEKNRQMWAAVLTGMAAGANSMAAAQSGYSYGTVGRTTWSSYSPGAAYAAQSIANQQNTVAFSRLSAQNAVALEDLKSVIRTTTVDSGQSFGGQLTFEIPREFARRKEPVPLVFVVNLGHETHYIEAISSRSKK